MYSTCYFHDCINPALPTGKCEKHRSRIKCSEPHCYNQTYARNLCVRHGGKKVCIHPNCTANARSKGFCSKHGEPSTKRNCEEEGCTRIAHSRRRCIYHGGSRKCKVTECVAYSRHSGYCRRHVSTRVVPQSISNLEKNLLSNTEFQMLDLSSFAFDIKLLDTPELSFETDLVFTDEDFVMLDYFIQ